jgi:hypothetical protein
MSYGVQRFVNHLTGSKFVRGIGLKLMAHAKVSLQQSK